ncbi:ATP-dependent DNA helicase [Bacillus thuringiensis]|uniref:UvrD-helicase domain-containing protein n=1 Tax=Bacillus thuringiensis TaxID=1428 RepID=UPI000BF96F05|nr:ATP-dependent helicase [Bacillus thuringiensis]PFF01367.1 ATP-dependent DNA helicase [Bacillus thuringiensis]
MPNFNSMDEVYKHFSFNPTDEQREAIESPDGPIYIVAGPGAGKTRVLLFRVLYIILFKKCGPEKIFIATFSIKAAKELEYGIQSLFSEISMYTGDYYDISGMYIGTVHSACRRLLSDRSFSINRRRHKLPKFFDEIDQYFFVKNKFIKICLDRMNISEEELKGWLGTTLEKQLSNKHDTTIALIEMFNRFTEECIDSNLLTENEDLNIKQCGILYDIYVTELETNNYVDYAFLQQKALKHVNISENSAFDYIIVDEYQDTNSVQEKLFFSLAKKSGNICVVGDDDQSLYRFRGASVACFVEFPSRVREYFNLTPKRVDLIDNFRSREPIVTFFRDFINQTDWSKGDGQGEYRIEDKEIKPIRMDNQSCVLKTTLGNYEEVANEIAHKVKEIIESGKVNNPNEIAFLFPSLKGRFVQVMRAALEELGLEVYAPRAGRFLECSEAKIIFGLIASILGVPSQGHFKGRFEKFHNWVDQSLTEAMEIVTKDVALGSYIEDMQEDIKKRRYDYKLLETAIKDMSWDLNMLYNSSETLEHLLNIDGISHTTKKALIKISKTLENKNLKTFTLKYVIGSATATDWNLLDLFYRLVGFDAFTETFQDAQDGKDNESIINLARITLYLSSFMDKTKSIISGSDFQNAKISNLLFNNFLYGLFLLEESEVEVKDSLFPLGRIPFLTIHQSKGLEFPVVVLGGLGRRERSPQTIESIIRNVTQKEGEPLERIFRYDLTRMFYVALSRAENLLIIPNLSGRGIVVDDKFKRLVRNNEELSILSEFDANTLPQARMNNKSIPRIYSYTSDFLLYQQCPRYFMLYREYGFVPSRSQTILFGSIVHRTIEDLHNFLISKRFNAN